MRGWRRGEIRRLDPCQVRNVIQGKTCGFPNYAWTNYMESLCKAHYYQRRVIQNLLIIMSGRGNWASLVAGFMYEEQFMTPNEIRAKYGFPPLKEA